MKGVAAILNKALGDKLTPGEIDTLSRYFDQVDEMRAGRRNVFYGEFQRDGITRPVVFDANGKRRYVSWDVDFDSLVRDLTGLWEGRTVSDVTLESINVRVAYGLPKDAKLIKLYCAFRDSAAWGSNHYHIRFGTKSECATFPHFEVRCYGGNFYSISTGEAPIDDNGNVWVNINVSGASTGNVYLRCRGFKI